MELLIAFVLFAVLIVAWLLLPGSSIAAARTRASAVEPQTAGQPA